MTSSSPDIESLIAAARERHREGGMSRIGVCNRCLDVWPCPDRLLIDALVPVYEAAKALVEWRDGTEFATYGNPDEGLSRVSYENLDRLDRLEDALRTALGEPNA